ncbi:transmembrane protein, putative (macronuclear) [Tetrahymena thermophila SB210]|uniref:Transmembrane protein, putative n=1 Tax=Tetrahymena thermophila (strain SB210) TaxID=312017 RepID=W7XAN1_TETTS|nr:transmembrane protein, putative [Tetrahymena thermophila SB210]EWS74397.1 transmembrane protein, putative [Tetrahymena thermophila SB210]|eukprot:XP_012653074.1 transmembrane protein, putative [Tetrahymena thermophila SB210]
MFYLNIQKTDEFNFWNFLQIPIYLIYIKFIFYLFFYGSFHYFLLKRIFYFQSFIQNQKLCVLIQAFYLNLLFLYLLLVLEQFRILSKLSKLISKAISTTQDLLLINFYLFKSFEQFINFLIIYSKVIINQNITYIIIVILAIFVRLHVQEQSSISIISKGKMQRIIIINSVNIKQIQSLLQSRKGLYLTSAKQNIIEILKIIKRQYLIGQKDKQIISIIFFISSKNQKYLLKDLFTSKLWCKYKKVFKSMSFDFLKVTNKLTKQIGVKIPNKIKEIKSIQERWLTFRNIFTKKQLLVILINLDQKFPRKQFCAKEDLILYLNNKTIPAKILNKTTGTERKIKFCETSLSIINLYFIPTIYSTSFTSSASDDQQQIFTKLKAANDLYKIQVLFRFAKQRFPSD